MFESDPSDLSIDERIIGSTSGALPRPTAFTLSYLVLCVADSVSGARKYGTQFLFPSVLLFPAIFLSNLRPAIFKGYTARFSNVFQTASTAVANDSSSSPSS